MNALKKLTALENEADHFGFKWEKVEQIMAQIQSEYTEITAHLDQLDHPLSKQKLQEEIGDLLHAVFSLCVFCKFDPQETLEKSIKKFERRLTAVKQIASQQGLTSLQNHSFDELMSFWKQAKALVG